MSDTLKKRIVLLGAGHAHLYSLKRAGDFTRRGHELIVLAPDAFWYSGLATGVLGGTYDATLDQVDGASLVARGGGRFVRASVIGLDPKERIICLAAQPPLSYDVLSVTLGSELPAIAGTNTCEDRVYAAKPIRRLWELRQHLERRFAASDGGVALRIVIAGAGATGCEIAANIAHLARIRRGRVSLTVLTAGEILRRFPRGAAHDVRAALEKRGVSFQEQARVVQISDNRAVLANGSEIPFDIFVNATGLRPAPVLSAFGLPLDASGGLIVDEHLRSIAAPEVHAAGDCIALRGHDLARVGVYAIRQAPVLFHNVLAAAEGTPPKKFRPQRNYLTIMNLGEGTGLAVRGRWHWQGRAAFWLKDWIDRRFLREYQRAADAG